LPHGRRSGAVLLWLLATYGAVQGCAVARWQVPMDATRGQAATQQLKDAEECDSLAQTSSGYDRGAEALAWLLVPPLAIVIIPTVLVVELLDVVTFRVFNLHGALKIGMDALNKPVYEGNASWSQYFSAYRQCMNTRGYAEPPR